MSAREEPGMYMALDSNIDIRLLRSAYLLLRERNVSRVAALLGVSQPAVSLSLKRARAAFGDPLLVRSGQQLVVTDRGREIHAMLEGILDRLTDATRPVAEFDPATAQLRMRVATMNCFGAFLIPAVVTSIQREARGIAVDFVSPTEHTHLASELEERVDLVIGSWLAPPANLRSSVLLNCSIACIMHRDHPLAALPAIELAEYMRHDHVSPTPIANAAYSPIDAPLAQMGLRRRVAVTVPEYAQIPELLRRTDLVFSTAKPYADYIAETVGNGELRVVPAPPEFGEMHLYMQWHERAHNSAPSRWLRGLIRREARRFDHSLHDLGTEGLRAG